MGARGSLRARPTLGLSPYRWAGPSPPCSSPLGLRHGTVWFLDSPRPESDVEIVCGPLGCGRGLGTLGGALGSRPHPSSEAAARPPPSPSLDRADPGWETGGEGGRSGAQRPGGPRPQHFLPLFVAASGAGSPWALPSSRSPRASPSAAVISQ